MFRPTALGLSVIVCLAPTFAFAATVTVNTGVVTHSNPRLLLGQAIDGRSNFRLLSGAIGYYNPTTGLPIDATPGTGVTWMWESLDQTALRYPLGPVNTWLWKSTIGPIASRANIPYQPYPNKATFGLDEFMATAAAQGVSADNVHMLVNIYEDVYQKDKTQAIQDAADLVAYLNATTGPWAAMRASNGHAAPYGVKLFNLGNEPWSPSTTEVEYNFMTATGAAAYAADSLEFIAAMKAVDPTIRVTLSATSPRPNAVAQATAWNQTLIDTCGSEMDGLVTNIFYDSTVPQQYGIGAVEGFIDGLASQAAAYNASHTNQIHVMVGEHGNSIVPAIGNTDPNFAMQWQGAVTMADFIGMLSQKPEIERAHSFVWGNGAAAWHPLRLDGYDANGLPIYTFLPVAGMADALDDVVLDQALAVDTVSPATANGLNSYSVRSSAYTSADGQALSVVLVNIDTLMNGSQMMDIAGTAGFTLTDARLLTALTPNAESFSTSSLAITPGQTQFLLPNQSVMLLEYVAVPEPSSAMLAGAAAIAGIAFGRRYLRGRRTRAGSSNRS